MLDEKDYKLTNTFATPQPHCIPGYTGYVPGSGPKRVFQMGKTYGRMTYDLLAEDPIAGSRLAPLDFTTQVDAGVPRNVWQREYTVKDVKRRHDMTPGYTGYIPRKQFYYGRSFVEESRSATEDYEMIQRKNGNIPRAPPQETFLTQIVPNVDVELRNNYASYASDMAPKFEKGSAFCMADVNKRNPGRARGHKGLTPGKALHPPCDPDMVRGERSTRGIAGIEFSDAEESGAGAPKVCPRCGHTPLYPRN